MNTSIKFDYQGFAVMVLIKFLMAMIVFYLGVIIIVAGALVFVCIGLPMSIVRSIFGGRK